MSSVELSFSRRGYLGMVSNDVSRLCSGVGIANRAATVKNEHAAVDASACMGCGVCVSKCSVGASHLCALRVRGAPMKSQMLFADAAQLAGE